MVNKLTHGHNLRWESSRMMLPEHVEALLHEQKEKKKVPKPILDEQALNDIGIIIMDSLHYTQEIKVTMWKDGYLVSHAGIVNKVDYQMKYILLEQDDGFDRIMIKDIIAVERL